MGLAYEANDNKIILVAQEFVPQSDDESEEEEEDDIEDLDDLGVLSQDEARQVFNLFESSDGEPQVVRMCAPASRCAP